MNQYGTRVLNALLKRYENSKLAKGETPKRTTRITFSFNDKTMPAYFAEDSYAHRPEIEAAMHRLVKAGFVSIEHDAYETSIERIHLNLENIESVYEALGRLSPKRKQAHLLAVLEQFSSQCETVQTVKAILRDKIQTFQPLKTWFDPDDAKELSDILKGLDALCTQQDIWSKRRFSVMVYQDSKRFERLQAKLFQCYKLASDKHFSSIEAWLDAHGIIATPTYLHIKGKATLTLHGVQIDLTQIGEEFILSSTQLPYVKIIALPKAKILTVENYTTFHDIEASEGLVLYLAGFHNRAKTAFLKAIIEAHPHTAFYHFGDLDVGGLRIFVNLRQKTALDVQPYAMDVATFEKHITQAKPLEGQDRNHLKAMREHQDYALFYPLIDRMLLTGKKLEQEAIDL